MTLRVFRGNDTASTGMDARLERLRILIYFGPSYTRKPKPDENWLGSFFYLKKYQQQSIRCSQQMQIFGLLQNVHEILRLAINTGVFFNKILCFYDNEFFEKSRNWKLASGCVCVETWFSRSCVACGLPLKCTREQLDSIQLLRVQRT